VLIIPILFRPLPSLIILHDERVKRVKGPAWHAHHLKVVYRPGECISTLTEESKIPGRAALCKRSGDGGRGDEPTSRERVRWFNRGHLECDVSENR
jgi:hypothetical protein